MRNKFIKMFHGVTVSQTCLCGLLAAALVVTAVPFTAQAAEADNEAAVSIGSVKPVNPWDGTIDTDWYDKSGTVYTISTPQQLAGLAELVNSGDTFEGKTVNLVQDIFLNGEEFTQEWISIASGGNVFEGTFNGNMHTIYNMYISENGEGGLFGCIGGKGTVKAVVIAQGDLSAGGCIADVNKGIISYCDNASFIWGTDVGGICNQNGNLVYGCRNLGEVFGGSCAAGIVCRNSGQFAVVSQCSNEGRVSSRHDASGIIYSNGGWVYDCYNKGMINETDGLQRVYGICGNVVDDKLTVRDCYSVGQLDGGNKYAICERESDNCYALSSDADAGDATIITIEEMQGADFVQKLNSTMKNRVNAWVQDTIGMNEGFPITVADDNRSVGKYKIQPEIWAEYDCEVEEGGQNSYIISYYYNEQAPKVSIKDKEIARISSEEIEGEEGKYVIEGLQAGTTVIQIHFDETENNVSTDCEIELTVTAKVPEESDKPSEGTDKPSGDILPISDGWYESDGKSYWYENGVRQGTVGRGKEIYDPESDAWYWLDAIQGGAKAVDKDVYQESSGGKWVRYDTEGRMIKGEDYRYGGWYYFEPVTGTMVKGPVVLGDGRKVFYDTVTGQMVKGELKINGESYYFDENDGHLVSGREGAFWVEIDGKQYWYENWQRQGWDAANPAYRGKEIYDPASDAWYWLDNVQQGAKAVSKDVYQESSGGKWVRYDENGRMIKGWSPMDIEEAVENWFVMFAGVYYFDPITGAMAKGEMTIGNAECYFDETTGRLISCSIGY